MRQELTLFTYRLFLPHPEHAAFRLRGSPKVKHNFHLIRFGKNVAFNLRAQLTCFWRIPNTGDSDA